MAQWPNIDVTRSVIGQIRVPCVTALCSVCRVQGVIIHFCFSGVIDFAANYNGSNL